ncbi:MAG TPA: hypothetical protein VHX20_15895 [Terracidiphilus sp.]|jgi:hypothetical protein|nr:hypothetical protein [Terracidiphilus sp.]
MYSFRRSVLLLALACVALPFAQAEGSSSNPQAPATQDSSQPAQSQPTQSHPAQETPQQLSVQARIRMRREQRRATAIHDAYDHLYEAYVGMGFLRFSPGKYLQRTTFYAWNTGLTRYYSERFGVNFDARGSEGIVYTGLQQGVTNAGNTRLKISMYNLMIGPTYRFYMQPKYSISGRVLGGVALSSFSGDTNGEGSTTFGIWPDGTTYSIDGSIIGQYNISPTVTIRLTGEDLATGFGSSLQNSFGFTSGVTYRFGRR